MSDNKSAMQKSRHEPTRVVIYAEKASALLLFIRAKAFACPLTLGVDS